MRNVNVNDNDECVWSEWFKWQNDNGNDNYNGRGFVKNECFPCNAAVAAVHFFFAVMLLMAPLMAPLRERFSDDAGILAELARLQQHLSKGWP